MIISSLSIFQGLLSRHCYPFRRSQNFGLSCELAKTFVLIALDMVLKLSVITMSVFIAGVELTLCWVFLFTILLLVTNIVHNLKDYQVASERNDNALVKYKFYVFCVDFTVYFHFPSSYFFVLLGNKMVLVFC